MTHPSQQTPKKTPSKESPIVIMGWREWVSLPNLEIRAVKAKIDTGARSSSLHAFDIETYEQEGRQRVRFKVHPAQRNDKWTIECHADVADIRSVRSSSGQVTERVVIQTPIRWAGQTWTIDLTLAPRFEMGFRMLIGREAIRGRFLVDAGKSYFGPKPRRRSSKRKPSSGSSSSLELESGLPKPASSSSVPSHKGASIKEEGANDVD